MNFLQLHRQPYYVLKRNIHHLLNNIEIFLMQIPRPGSEYILMIAGKQQLFCFGKFFLQATLDYSNFIGSLRVHHERLFLSTQPQKTHVSIPWRLCLGLETAKFFRRFEMKKRFRNRRVKLAFLTFGRRKNKRRSCLQQLLRGEIGSSSLPAPSFLLTDGGCSGLEWKKRVERSLDADAIFNFSTSHTTYNVEHVQLSLQHFKKCEERAQQQWNEKVTKSR